MEVKETDDMSAVWVARKKQPMIFTTFTMQPGLKRGRNHYANDNGSEIIAYCANRWNIGSAEDL